MIAEATFNLQSLRQITLITFPKLRHSYILRVYFFIALLDLICYCFVWMFASMFEKIGFSFGFGIKIIRTPDNELLSFISLSSLQTIEHSSIQGYHLFFGCLAKVSSELLLIIIYILQRVIGWQKSCVEVNRFHTYQLGQIVKT